jgi:hypothetical protein
VLAGRDAAALYGAAGGGRWAVIDADGVIRRLGDGWDRAAAEAVEACRK